jgi:hypothetical protein
MDAAGRTRNFAIINPGWKGYTDVSGIKVDKKRRWVWAVSTNIKGRWYTAQLQAFEISTGNLKQSFAVKDTVKHIFNDLVLDAQGNVYFTDTYFGSVYKADPSTKKLSLLVKDSLTAFPNGIALGNNRQLYIATYSHGLLRYDLVTKKLSRLTGFTNAEMAYNLDGLWCRDHSLFGVYNSARHKKDNALLEYVLDASGTRIIDEKIIDKGNPLFRKPTTLAMFNEQIFLLAVTNIDEYNENKNSVKGIEARLVPVKILVYDLK